MIESDEKLREKEQAEEVAAQLRQFEDVFGSYTDALDKKEQKERYLAGVLLHTIQCCQQKEQEKEAAQQTQEHCRSEDVRIRLEELSEQFHRISADLCETEQTAEQYNAKIPGFQERAESAKKERRLMQAAEYKSARIRAEQELQAAQNLLKTLAQGDEAEHLQNLGYSLRIGYRQAAQEAGDALSRIRDDLQANKREQEQLAARKKEQEEKRDSLIATKAGLEQKLHAFEARSEDYRKSIGELPETGMTGELIPESVAQLRETLSAALEQAQQKVLECEQQLEQNAQALQDNSAVQEQLEQQLSDAQETLRIERTCMENHQQEINRITDILRKYEIDSRFLYEKEENLLRMKEKCSLMQAERDDVQRQLDRTEEILEKMRNNCLHTAPQFGKLLAENGIAYQTGEAYLKQQDQAFQEQLLAKNPLLPYCYLVSDSDYQKVLSIPQDTFADRLCPVLRKRDIEFTAQADAHFAALGELRLYSLYDRESMEPGGQYAQKLTERREALRAEMQKLDGDLSEILTAIRMVEQFTLTQQIVDAQAQTVHDAEARVNRLIAEKQAKKEEAAALAKQKDSLQEERESARKLEELAKKRFADLQEYLKLAEAAENDRTSLFSAKEKLRKIQTELRICEDNLEKFREAYQELREEQSQAEHDQSDAQKKMAEYAQYLDGKTLSGDLRQLEMEYQPLYRKQSQSRTELDDRCSRAQEQISYHQNQLQSRFHDLDDAEIPSQFDGTKLEMLEERAQKASEALALQKQKAEQEAHKEKELRAKHQKTRAALAKEGLNEPLSTQEIKGNYPKRREENDKQRRDALEQENSARKALDILTTRKNALGKIVDLDTIPEDVITPIAEETDLSAERTAFQKLRSDADNKKKTMDTAYNALRERYLNAEHWIAEMISFIRFEDCLTYSSCYYVFEQLKEKEQMLLDHIRLLQTELSNIENNRAHIIRQIYEHADFLFKQVHDISTNSVVNLQGKRRKMLEIVLPDKLDSQAQQRIANLVDEVTLKLRQQIVLDAQAENKLFEAICSSYSDRVIFNAYTNLQTIRVRVLKILQDERNSRLENWEARYSGGERFITYFIAYSALADYTRRKSSPNQSGKIRSVFMVDNPFGEASSDHLVGTLMEITQKFHMQLICFSDLKQSSITNHFDLIYQLSMRKILYSNKSQLHTEHVINHAEAMRDSRLEYISMKSQLSFFDD